MNKGFFISLEGIDGVGKSTQIPLLAEKLREYFPDREVLTSFEPGGGDYGQKIRGLLFDVKQAGVVNLHRIASGLLYLSDHIQHQYSKIIPALSTGSIVLQDRSFMDSQRAYYGESDLCYDAHNTIHKECCLPDLTILMVQNPKDCLDRAIARGDSKFLAKPWSNEKSLTEIQERYFSIAYKEPKRFIIAEIDKEETIVSVSTTLFKTIRNEIPG